MVRSFFKPIPRNDTTYLDLPPCYDLSYPVGPVLLTTDDDRIWGVTVEQKSNSFQITTGWSKVVKDLQIVVGDFVVFEWFEHITFRVTLLKDVQTKDVSNKFPFWLIIPARNRMFLPEDYVEHHFKDNMIPHPVVIRFGDVYQWTVLLQWYLIGYFFSDGWNDVYKDLKWRIGDFLMFEKVADYEFKLDFFREDGMRVDPDEIGNEADEVIEVIEVSSDESEDGDSQNNNAVPDHEVIKKVTKKFRFPIAFGKECEFENLQSLRIEVENGMSIIKKLRVEGSGSKRRFAIREWKSCMKKLRIRNGRLYRIMYFEMEGKLVFSRA